MKRGIALLLGWLMTGSGCGLLNKEETQCHEGKWCPRGLACDAETATCVSVPAGMVWVEGGAFLMGNDAADDLDANPDEAPKHMETLRPFIIDQTEVTVKAYAAFLQDCPAECQRELALDLQPGTELGCNWNTGRDNHPINCVTQTGAAAYCQRVGKRLPTEAEWEYVARGAVRSKYPWGSESPDAQLCWSGKQSRSGTCEVGQYVATLLGSTDLRGQLGIFDLAGNVSEWTSTPYCSMFNGAGNCSSKNYSLRGGSWGPSAAQYVRAAFRGYNNAATWNSNVGFRCARD